MPISQEEKQTVCRKRLCIYQYINDVEYDKTHYVDIQGLYCTLCCSLSG